MLIQTKAQCAVLTLLHGISVEVVSLCCTVFFLFYATLLLTCNTCVTESDVHLKDVLLKLSPCDNLAHKKMKKIKKCIFHRDFF